MLDQSQNATSVKRHYWLREDFDQLIELLPRVDLKSLRGGAASEYPKTTRQVFAELLMRGLHVDTSTMSFIMRHGKACVAHKTVDDRWENLAWEKDHVDAAAEWLYGKGKWSSRTHFCANGNLRYGQVVKAYCVAAARFGLPFVMGFDLKDLVAVIEPADDANEYAYVRFFPRGTTVESRESDA